MKKKISLIWIILIISTVMVVKIKASDSRGLFIGSAEVNNTFIEIQDPIAREGIPITVKCYNLRPSYEYRLNASYNPSGEFFIASNEIQTIKLDHKTPSTILVGQYIEIALYFEDSIREDSVSVVFATSDYYSPEDVGGDNIVMVFGWIIFCMFFIAVPAIAFEKTRKR